MPDSPVRIPPHIRSRLNLLVSCSDEAVDALRRALGTAAPALWPESLAGNVSEQVPQLRIDELSTIVSMLAELEAVRTSLSQTVEEFADGLSRSPDWDAEDDDRGRLRMRLAQLLLLEPLRVTSKAGSVVYEHQHVMQTARILTDLRPVFADDATVKPAGAAVTHALKITYADSGLVKEFFLSMDAADLERLQGQISRALIKAHNLETLLGQVGIRHLTAAVESTSPPARQ